MASHTPGPWKARTDAFRPYVTAPSPRGTVHEITVADCVHPVDALHSHQEAANARLIAQAPALPQSCRELYDLVYGAACPVDDPAAWTREVLARAGRAILSAGGGEP